MRGTRGKGTETPCRRSFHSLRHVISFPFLPSFVSRLVRFPTVSSPLVPSRRRGEWRKNDGTNRATGEGKG